MEKAKQILNDLKVEYEKYDSMVKESRENLKMLKENKEMEIRKSNESEILTLRLKFRNENYQTEIHKQKLLDTYNEHKTNKDLPIEKLRALRSQYKHFHEAYVKTLKIQKQLITSTELDHRKTLISAMYRITIRNENNEKFLHLIKLRDTVKELLDSHKSKMAAERRAIRITKDALETPMEDVCSICYDNHATKDTIITCCKHQYGTQCYVQHIKSSVARIQTIRCPMCNKSNPSIIIFREKEARVRRAKGMPVRGKGAIGDAVYLLALSKVRA